MISRLVIIREALAKHLGGVAVSMAVEQAEKADHAVVTLSVGERKYGLSVKSSSAAPPLGEVILTDRQTGDVIRGDVQELVWMEVATHIKAAGKPAVVVPIEAPPPAPMPLPVALPADGRWPTIGVPVVYTPHPSQARGGVSEMGGQVTKVYLDGTVAITALPYGGDILSLDRLPRRRSSADVACWDFLPESDTAALHAEIDDLRQMIEDLTAPTSAVGDEVKQLREAAEAAGIKIDRRWGGDRLRQEIETHRKARDAA